MKLTEKDIQQLNQFENLLKFKRTWIFERLIHTYCTVAALFTGNQFGKNGNTAVQYVMRIIGTHPIPNRNMVYFECPDFEKHGWKAWKSPEGEIVPIHQKGLYGPYTRPEDGKCTECGKEIQEHIRGCYKFRFASQTKPGDSGNIDTDGTSAEVNNTQYPEFKKWLPPFLIKKDITARNSAMTLKNIHGRTDIVVDFVSYNQSTQSTAGVQRVSIWEDEEAPPDFHEEQVSRLLAEDGDLIISCTPANRMSWLYDEVYEKAKFYFKTQAICDFLAKDKEESVARVQTTDTVGKNIAVFQAATDDNPTLKKEVIEELLGTTDDPNVLAIRRYGVFKQISGRIFKDFDLRVHVISKDKYFPDGMFEGWRMARMIDYHEHNPWAVAFMALSPDDEAFIFDEWNPSPEKFVTMEIAQKMASMSRDYKFHVNLIDPLAAKTQSNTGTSVVEDLNRLFYQFKRDSICTGGYWESWDTKSTRGRDEIRKRLKNAALVGKPFNNTIVGDRGRKKLPTLWVLDNCVHSANSLRKWRLEEWIDKRALVTKDMKDKPQQKWSHFPTAFEAIFKDSRWRPIKQGIMPPDMRKIGYMQGRR